MLKAWMMWAGLALGLVAVAIGLSSEADLASQWGAAARYTARAGFPLLILAYIARPLHQLVKIGVTKALLANRKWIGLGFAMCHSVHLAALILAIETSGGLWDISTVVLGGGAYLTMYAMAFTSNNRAMKALGKWWRRLHTFGIHYLWAVFLVTYAGRLAAPETFVLGAVTVGIALLAGAIRLAAWLKTRAKRKSAV